MDKQPNFTPVAESGLPGCGRTLRRRAKDDPDFPPVYTFGNRNYFLDTELAEYKQKLIERGLAAVGRNPKQKSSGREAA